MDMTQSTGPAPCAGLHSAEACSELGALLHRDGRMADAMACYERALALDPGFAKAQLRLGNLLIEQGKRDEAVARYRQALALKPDYVGAHNNLANALSEQ